VLQQLGSPAHVLYSGGVEPGAGTWVSLVLLDAGEQHSSGQYENHTQLLLMCEDIPRSIVHMHQPSGTRVTVYE